jgi:hypothetical protein
VGPRGGLDAVEKRKIILGIEPRPFSQSLYHLSYLGSCGSLDLWRYVEHANCREGSYTDSEGEGVGAGPGRQER